MRTLGVPTGIGGLVTIFPSHGDMAGAVFGLGSVAWFVAIGAARAADRCEI